MALAALAAGVPPRGASPGRAGLRTLRDLLLFVPHVAYGWIRPFAGAAASG
jgi:hypothetical protein